MIKDDRLAVSVPETLQPGDSVSFGFLGFISSTPGPCGCRATLATGPETFPHPYGMNRNSLQVISA